MCIVGGETIHYLVFVRGVLKYNGYSHERVYYSVSFQPSPQFHACFLKTLTIIVYLNFSLHAGFLQHSNLIAFSPKIYVSLMFYPSNCSQSSISFFQEHVLGRALPFLLCGCPGC